MTDTERDYNGETRDGWGWTDDAMEWRASGQVVVSIPFEPVHPDGGHAYVTNVGTAIWGPYENHGAAVTAAIAYLTSETT